MAQELRAMRAVVIPGVCMNIALGHPYHMNRAPHFVKSMMHGPNIALAHSLPQHVALSVKMVLPFLGLDASVRKFRGDHTLADKVLCDGPVDYTGEGANGFGCSLLAAHF